MLEDERGTCGAPFRRRETLWSVERRSHLAEGRRHGRAGRRDRGGDVLVQAAEIAAAPAAPDGGGGLGLVLCTRARHARVERGAGDGLVVYVCLDPRHGQHRLYAWLRQRYSARQQAAIFGRLVDADLLA